MVEYRVESGNFSPTVVKRVVFNRFLGRNETVYARYYRDCFTRGKSELLWNRHRGVTEYVYTPTVWLDPSNEYRV